EGKYLVREIVPSGYFALPDDEQEVVILAGGFSAIVFQHASLGCTPGFWQGGAGAPLWDGNDDADWVPFTHNKVFNTEFNDDGGGESARIDARLDEQTMLEIVSNTGGSANSAEKASRDMVAAYLNESAFPGEYPAESLIALEEKWYKAVAGGDSALDAFHLEVAGWNAPEPPGYCPLP
ncbi:MAG: hypothetical protein PVG14_20220, partial [Anaerolineales bacterium]